MSTPDYQFIDGWKLRETRWKPEEESAKATVFALANGYMGSRGAFEEADPTAPGVVGNYINGIYDTPLGKLTEREIVNIPDWHHITLEVDGEPFDMTTAEVLDYWRELDMREGILRRHVRWKSPKGKVFTLDAERFLSMVRPNLAGLRLRWAAEGAADLDIAFRIAPEVNNRWADHTSASETTSHRDGLQTVMRTRDPGYEVGIRTDVSGREFGFLSFVSSTDGGSCEDSVFDEDGGTYTMLTAIHDNRFTEGRLEDSCRVSLDEAKTLGYEALKAEHIARWAEIWERSDVVIDGDDDAQLGIRFSLFHLLAAAPWWSDKVSIPARGLQGQDYYGSIFWDCEIFVFPMLAATQPEAARNCMGYRFHTLNGARRKANNYGFDGAFYAWQSQETGDDQCALYVFVNPFTGRPMRAPFSDQQVHISADIVYALWQYYVATRDEDFIRERGLEIACEVARFFSVRADQDEKGAYHLRGVLGPDEYHEDVTDDAYTNALVKRVFDVALYLYDHVSRTAPDAVEQMKGKIRLTDAEVEGWKSVRDALYVPQSREDGVIEQFEGYFGLEDAPIDVVRSRLAHPDLHPGGPLGPFQSTQVLKQADVVMMLYLLRDQFSPQIKRANWEYYEPRTSHDSSLSPMAYSLVAADVGMTDWAYRYFIQTSHIDLSSYGPHWNLGIHAAGLGGAWLALIHGFCQVSQDKDALILRDWPSLPEQWGEVRFHLIHQRQVLAFTVKTGSFTLEHKGDFSGAEAQPITVRTPQGSETLEPGQRLELTHPRLA